MAEEPGPDRRQRRRDEGRERGDAADDRGDEPGRAGGEADWERKGEQRAEEGRDTLAALEIQPDREEVAEEGGEARHLCRVLTGDGLEVVIDLSVLYHIIPDRAPEILRTIGRGVTDKIVRPVSRTKIRDNAVFYDAVALYSTKRDEFQQKIYTTIEKEFQTRGIILEAILIRNITLPESVRQTIESKINAEQEAQKMKFILDKERQEADRKRVEAQGIADYQRILTSTLTDRLLQYEQIKAQKEIATSPNSKVVVMGSGKTAPILIGQ